MKKRLGFDAAKQPSQSPHRQRKTEKQRSSETQNIENDKKDGNSDTESPRRLLGKDSVA
ncbi:peptide chain release factor RF2 [Neisseria mucosa]|uniref:peptide chain release factor RF2 n=1 Tax=Neisseria mucosa TaxID=488 RepID=UPI00155E7A27|nr:peptide chain release factor RF2 [Neisseria mucosa]